MTAIVDYTAAKQRLSDMETELLARLRDRTGLVAERHADEMDQIQSLSAREQAARDITADYKLMAEIQYARRRISLRQYESCEACGGDIKSKRLQARPTATLCVQCQEYEESKCGGLS